MPGARHPLEVGLKFPVAFVLVCALLAGPARADDASLQKALRADLSQYLAKRAKAEHISGLSLSINLKDQADNINAVAGTTQFGGNVPVAPDNLYQIGSNTKAFTAVTILQLEAEGKLTIEQTVGDFLPQYPAWKSIEIRRLLNMTSGIPEYDEVPSIIAAMVKNPYRTFTTAELVAAVYPDHAGAPKPTTGWSYSNTNYILAEMIIERVTGNSYESELETRFLGDPKLSDTFYRPSLYPPEILKRTVSGYFFNTDPGNEGFKSFLGRDVRNFSLSWARGAGGIIATPEDVTYWSRRLYEGDMLAPKQRGELMSLVSTKSGRPIAATSASDHRGFALGVAQNTIPGFGTFWYYEGETLGYRMIYFWFPKSDAVVAIGLNSQPDSKQDQAGPLLVTIYRTLHAAGKV
jgi:D-alanyl-D-alanine carboxypeptidase